MPASLQAPVRAVRWSVAAWMLVIALAGCGGGGETPLSSGLPPVDSAALPGGSELFTAAAAPRMVSPALDGNYRTSGLITDAGGSLVLAGAGGVRYTLTVPAGALVLPTTISMTALRSVDGDGFDRFVAGVHLEPWGLQFLKFVTVEIEGVTAPPRERRVFAGIDGPLDGELFMALFDNGSDALRLRLSHFSAGYVAEGSAAQRAAAIRAYTTAQAQRLESALAVLLADATIGPDLFPQLIDEFRTRYQRDVIDTQVGAGQLTCALGQSTIAAAFSLTRTLQLLGNENPDVRLPASYFDAVIDKCLEEANCSLVKSLQLQRQAQLLGASAGQLARLDAEEARCNANWYGQLEWSLSGDLTRTDNNCVYRESREGSGLVEYNSAAQPVSPIGGVLPAVSVRATEARRNSLVCTYERPLGDESDCYRSKTEHQYSEQGVLTVLPGEPFPLTALVSVVGPNYLFYPSAVLVPTRGTEADYETLTCNTAPNERRSTVRSRVFDNFVGPLFDTDLGGPLEPDQKKLAGSQTSQPQAVGTDSEFRAVIEQSWTFTRP